MTAVQPIRVVEPTDVLWARIGAWVVDGLVAVVPAALVLAVVTGGWAVPAAVVTGLVIGLADAVLLQGATGATVGKLVAGIRVVDASGTPCTTHQALVRTAGWVVDGLPGLPLVGYAAAFGDRDGQRFGDRWAGTYVVAARYVGHEPFAVAFPTDGSAPYRLEGRAAYLASPVVNHPTGPAAPTPAPAPATLPPTAPVTALGPAAPDPLLDATDRRYRRWDEVLGAWVVFDEDARAWRPDPAAADDGPTPAQVSQAR